MNGFLLINKEKGITSFGVCNKIKHIFNEPHVGHTGTLDPDTTGVLVIALGKACKLMPLLNEHDKSYKTTILFGKSTNTLDISGEVLKDIKCDISKEALNKALEELKNRTKQKPPMFSAIKKNGIKMYDLARKGIEVELEARDIKIYDYKASDIYDIDGYKAVDILLDVSKGFYVRSYARDLGEILGVPSLMYSLCRTSAGDFKIEKCVNLCDATDNSVLSIDDVFNDLEVLNVNDYIAHLAKNGVTLDERQIKTNKPFKVKHDNKLVAIYSPVSEYKYKPIVIL